MIKLLWHQVAVPLGAVAFVTFSQCNEVNSERLGRKVVHDEQSSTHVDQCVSLTRAFWKRNVPLVIICVRLLDHLVDSRIPRVGV
jgi:hypothetical protein